MKSELVKASFDEQAVTYSDAARRVVVPCFDDFYGTGIRMLACNMKAPRVLDVGAGTGLYSARLVERYPDASLTLIDFSEEMLELAKKRFVGRANTNYLIGDYTSYSFGSADGSDDGSFDIVISALSIHHLDAAGKASFYQRVFGLLGAGGEFLNADCIRAESQEIQDRYIEAWFEDLRSGGAGEDDIARMRHSMRLDDPSPVAAQLTWFKDAGFTIAECVYQFRNFAVMYGRK